MAYLPLNPPPSAVKSLPSKEGMRTVGSVPDTAKNTISSVLSLQLKNLLNLLQFVVRIRFRHFSSGLVFWGFIRFHSLRVLVFRISYWLVLLIQF